MDKLKRVWNLMCVPMAFFLGALNMWIGETAVGCMFILFATNETINNDKQIGQSMKRLNYIIRYTICHQQSSKSWNPSYLSRGYKGRETKYYHYYL